MDELTNGMQYLAHDPYKEYQKLCYTSNYSIDELVKMSDQVIQHASYRYRKYKEYINFDDEDLQIVLDKINDFFLSKLSIRQKIQLIKDIDASLIKHISKTE